MLLLDNPKKIFGLLKNNLVGIQAGSSANFILENTMKKFGIALLVVLTGCVTIDDGGDGGGDGGGSADGSTGKSGVVSVRKVTDFTVKEKANFCEWVSAESAKAEGEFTCDDGSTGTISALSTAQCESELAKSPGCEASKLEACFEVLFGNPCDFENEACANLSACAEAAGNNGDTNPNNSNPNNMTPTKKKTGETCKVNDECETGCIIGADDVLGYCTNTCEDFSDCPDFWDCAQVGNATGKFCLQGE